MRLIQLTQGCLTKVDAAFYEWLNAYSWSVHVSKRYVYAQTAIRQPNGKQKTIFMHRMILGLTKKGEIADHINHDGLDNRMANLRKSTYVTNGYNRVKSQGTKNIYKGVFWHKNKMQWLVQIVVNKQQMFLGYYDDPKEGAKVWNEAAKKYHCEFAVLNDI